MRPYLFALALLAFVGAPAMHAGYHVAGRIHVGGPGGWDYAAVDSAARRLYVTHDDSVVVVDTDTLKVVGQVGECHGMGGVALAPELNRGYAANGADDTVTVFALDTLKPLAHWRATGKRPNQILFEPATRRVFTFNSTGRNATVFDAVSGDVLGTIELDGRTEFPVVDGKGMIYESLKDKATEVAIDARTLKVTATYSLAPHSEPAGISMDPVRRRLFIGCRSKSLVVLDADTGKIVQALPIGEGNDAVTFDPLSRLVFASNGDGTLDLIRVGDNDRYTMLEKVTTEYGARTLAFDPKTRRLFLPTSDFGAAPAPTAENPNPQREAVPNTFRILVLEP
jgi:DNA-binding beta-propeller fold protein YncE